MLDAGQRFHQGQSGFLLEFLGRSESLALFHRLRCVCHDLIPLSDFSRFGSGLPYAITTPNPTNCFFDRHTLKNKGLTRGGAPGGRGKGRRC